MKKLMVTIMATLGMFSAFSADVTAKEVADNWEWHDGSTLPQEGRGFSDTESPYVRVPVRHKDKCSPAVWSLAHNSSGICIRFSTDSRAMRIRWKVRDPQIASHNLTGAARSGIDVYVQDVATGKWKFKQGSRPMATSNEVEFAWTPTRACMIYLPLYNVVDKFEVGLRKGAYVKPLPPRKNGVTKPVVCYGTSITQGGSASRPGMAWTAIAARHADVPFVDLGFAGSGKMEMSMVDVVAEVDSSLYVLDCLWNMSEQMVEERFEPFVRELKKRRPATPILCAEDCSTFQDRTKKGMIVEKTIAKLKAENPKLWKDLYFIPNTEQLRRDGEETVDGCHPNDWGMMHMGESFAARYRQILGLK